ncbi:MAG: ABC transporter permease subunit [Actinomycetales bacterium]|nr:ABC transporter permease subunit [Actinomycetales bacterium]
MSTVLPSLLRRSLREYRRLAVGWTAGAVTWVLVYTAFYPRMRDQPEAAKVSLETVSRSVRDALGWTDYSTGTGYLQATVFGQFLPLIVILCAVLLGRGAIVVPEQSGLLDVYLANPIGRRRLVLERFAAMTAVLTLVCLGTFTATWVMNGVLDMGVPTDRIAATCLAMLLLALVFGALTLAVSGITGRGALVLTVTGATVAATFLLDALGQLVEGMRPYRVLSPFHHYLGPDPLHTGFHPGHLLVLAGISAVLVAVAAQAFERRDVGV